MSSAKKNISGVSFGNHDWLFGTSQGAGRYGFVLAVRADEGALNYVAETGSNTLYFLPMNIGGDAKDTFPTIADQDRTPGVQGGDPTIDVEVARFA